eukprot:NODE_481_length_6950_cov_0.533353.p6 type:complete len:233 gc:universal NODE_481_length_6950_cov_0.533353:4148-4846(+)
MTSLWTAFNYLPFFTRFLLGSAIVIPLLGKFLINPYHMVLIYDKVKRFELWRLYTCVFFSGISFNWLFMCFFLYQQSIYLEKKMRKAEYFFFLVFIWINLLAIAYFQQMGTLFVPLTSALVYLWSRFNSEAIVTFYFGIQFPGKYLPWVYVAMEYLNPMPQPIPPLIGILVSHGYYYITTNEMIATPKIFDDIYNKYLLPVEPTEGPHVSDVNAGRARQGPRPFVGRGQRLG